MKTCSKCKIEKELGEFYGNSKAKDGHLTVCKQCSRLSEKQRYLNPDVRERKNKQDKIRRNNKKLEISKQKQEYRSRPEVKLKRSQYNKEYVSLSKNKEKRSLYKKAYDSMPENRERKNKQQIEYFSKPINKQKRSINNKERRETDIQYRLSCNLRRRLTHFIKGRSKNGSAVRDLGCSIEDLKKYLESKFQDGMSWDNYGFYGWHIDHIIPLSSFDLTNREELLKAVHYTNLQPLWAKDNLSKSDKMPHEL